MPVSDDERQRQRQEINMFAAMALGGAPDGDSDDPSDHGNDNLSEGNAMNNVRGEDDVAAADDASGKNEEQTATTAQSSLTTTSNTILSSSSSSGPQDPSKGDVTDDGSGPAATATTTRKSSSHIRGGSSEEFSAGNNNNNNNRSSQDMFAAAAAAMSLETGSFALTKSSNMSSSVKKSLEQNLESAAAALEDSSSDQNRGRQGSGTNLPPIDLALLDPDQLSPRKQLSEQEDVPMFAEEVIMPRPLFFGAVMPPRVITEARTMVKDAVKHFQETQKQMQERTAEPGDPPEELELRAPQLSQLPHAVRNVVGAIRTHGFNLDVFEDLDQNENHSNKSADTHDFWRGNPNVSTFQPCWGDAVRAERVKKYRKRQRPSTVCRTSTAPARLGNLEEKQFASALAAASAVESRNHNKVDATETRRPSGIEDEYASSTNESSNSNSVLAEDKIQESNNQFSMWLQNGDDDSITGGGGGGSYQSAGSNHSFDSFTDPSNTKAIPATTSTAEKNAENTVLSPRAPTEQELFSQWAGGVLSDSNPNRGGSVVSSQDANNNSQNGSDNLSSFNRSTFQKIPLHHVGSDDDSVIDDELKKQVGVNDNMSKAIASLTDAGQPVADITTDESKLLLSQVPQDSSKSRFRPLSNFEVTNGCVPVFGVDDTPLPVESDLGIHETKEEQQRSNDQKRSQDIIGKFVAPNVFGPVACPSPALNPDDCHSWNSRGLPNQQGLVEEVPGNASGANGPAQQLSLPSLRRPQIPDQSGGSASNGAVSAGGGGLSNSNGIKPPNNASSRDSNTTSSYKRRLMTRSRYGWWNVPSKETDSDNKNKAKRGNQSEEADSDLSNDKKESPELQLRPLHHSSSALQVVTLLDPDPEDLRESNLPLSRMHASTSMAQTLPYLSDRPPSYRYLQIDTQAVGFPPIDGEVEPLFCSLAIYNVETLSNGTSDEQTAAPIPYLQRCGRVTEALNFDVVSEPEVAERCSGSLWPHDRASPFMAAKMTDRSQGTRCGVFPLPTNLSVANLYAVLVVQKVLSEEADLNCYLKPGKNATDLAKLRANAEKSSNRHGSFLMPFAFGVAPLLQVFGTDNPVVASSRAVQIPLFRFSGGERQVIDHIMVMLYPRADHRANGIGGPAAVTNGGTAMLVMRNFGYLGLHAVVDNKSSLARDRLVDFTGELQLRRKDLNEIITEEEKKSDVHIDNYTVTLPDWHPDFIAEPTVHGGRNIQNNGGHSSLNANGPSLSHLYAQELAPLPLQMTPSVRVPSSIQPGMPRGRLHGNDIEPFYHTSFCNELLFHPRLLHNCPKGNIVIRAELRELEWKHDFNGYFAHLPSCGPSLHNSRRGPFLVQSAFTSCSPRGSTPHFIDEFKLKLPLDLKPNKPNSVRTFALLFTIHNARISPKNKWKRAKKLFGNVSESSPGLDDLDLSSRLEQVACGFLPLTTHGVLIDNGMHDVRVIYAARSPPREMQDSLDPTTLVLVERGDGGQDSSVASTLDGRKDSFAETTTSIDSEALTEGVARTDGSRSPADFSNIDLQSRSGKTKSISEPISLSVRVIVHSSLHSQNEVLSEFLGQEPDFPRLSNIPGDNFVSNLRMRRDVLKEQSEIQYAKAPQHAEDKLLESTIDITKHQLCSLPRSTNHLLRIMSVLWKALITGNGKPDLVWANPSAPLPLRVHCFATILHLLGAASLYMSKNGVTQVDGVSKWNVVTLGRVLALCFDEAKLFGHQAVEAFDGEEWMPSEPPATTPPDRRTRRGGKRHVRQSYDLSNEVPPREDTAILEFIPPNDIQAPSSPKQSSIHNFSTGSINTSLESPWEPNGKVPGSKDIKIDSKTDFQSALRAAASEDDPDGAESDGGIAARAMIQAFNGTSAGNRRWMTAPSPALSTIRETDDIDEEINAKDSEAKLTSTDPSLDQNQASVDGEIVLNAKKRPVKQFRVPKLKKAGNTAESKTLESIRKKDLFQPEEESSQLSMSQSSTIPSLLCSDDEIESVEKGFLDVIGKSLGVKSAPRDAMTGEEKRVGSTHHRKTKSRTGSIDWTLPGDERTLQSAEASDESNKDFVNQLDNSMSTLHKEDASSIRLPSFIDRLKIMGKYSDHSARWFPYAYEVIIMQWAAILIEQRASGERTTSDSRGEQSVSGQQSRNVNESLAQAALRTVGVAVASAPMLFEVIKQSLGFRVASLFNEVLGKNRDNVCPPLITLDETLLVSLEQVISMVADACMDSRNFDSRDLRQMSIDVNDSIVRFLRDLFSFLTPSCVHKLTLTYLSRFITKDGKQWQDRESSIGLRCSWEIMKLRLNAVTAFIRFPDFIRVNGPQMLNWWESTSIASNKFFDNTLEHYQKLRLQQFVGGEGTMQKLKVDIPSMQPHWLAEIVVDVCLLGTEHAEHEIQNRSASLLHEIFWSCSQESTLSGTCGAVASMYITLLEKLLSHVSYLSNFAPKSQLRKGIMPCAVFVLQSTPPNLLRALWRRFCSRVAGKGMEEKYGGLGSSPLVDVRENNDDSVMRAEKSSDEIKAEPDALDMFSLLNLALRSLEYEGCDEHLEADNAGETRDNVEIWRSEYLLAQSREEEKTRSRRRASIGSSPKEKSGYTSSISRKWQAHDGSLVIINAGHQIIREMYYLLNSSAGGKAFLNPARSFGGNDSTNTCTMTMTDIVVFVRAATSLYLHALALRESDIVTIRAFNLSAEVLKIFGIKIFLDSVGETLQHWMRVLSLHCGDRRAQVRVEATDLLELILRSTWEYFGSFFRVRVPLLAVQTEVMERIVATAATRYYRDQRRLGVAVETFSNVSAEASLVPLWRTLDRIETQPASQNDAFRSALIRLAGKLKKLYRAYVAARVLSFINNARETGSSNDDNESRDHETEALVRANRINVLRVINASEGYSKQFLGFQGTTEQCNRVAHYEAVEDALIDAADVFSPTELPEHRVAWLRMLAEFHSTRKKYAEEATCHYQIHLTLQQAARIHGSLWSNTPFLPWTDNMPDPVYIDGDNPAEPDFNSVYDFEDVDDQYRYGRQMDNTNSFRRIFYRVANSVGMNDDWETGVSKNLFCGITFASEYHTVNPWITLREMEESMVEQAEAAGDLFQKAGIIVSSRYAWNLAAQYYAEKFNYVKLAFAYTNLARTIVSQVPTIDASLPQEVSAILGRFYRVWFHGGAPDELSGVEFVYRADGDVRLDQFGENLREVIKSIMPDNTPTHLVLDGRVEELLEEGTVNYGFSRIGPAPLEPVKIKVTPLRPLLGRYSSTRGVPEWFHTYVDEAFSGPHHRSKNGLNRRERPRRGPVENISSGRSFSASVFSSTGSSAGGAPSGTRSNLPTVGNFDRTIRYVAPGEGSLASVDKFCFVQPRDRTRGNKDWWKTASGDFAEKTLKVTQLQVAQAFPACVARQAVVHRIVYSQSPLEAGVDSVCQWCAVLFRTAVSTVGMTVLRKNTDPGIGTDAAKVVADSIHSSHVKEIGLALLKKNSDLMEGDSSTDFMVDYDRLTEDEIKKLQLKLCRLLVVFIELLHLLIARNRDILLDVIQERKKDNVGVTSLAGGGSSRGYSRGATSVPESVERKTASRQASSQGDTRSQDLNGAMPSYNPRDLPARSRGQQSVDSRSHQRPSADELRQRQNQNPRSQPDDQSYHSTLSAGVRTDSAIAVQSELQRAFINLNKALYPRLHSIMRSDTPRWLKQCAQDNYFSLYLYRQTKIPIAEELCFNASDSFQADSAGILPSWPQHDSQSQCGDSPRGGGSVGGSSHSVVSRGSERYGFGQF